MPRSKRLIIPYEFKPSDWGFLFVFLFHYLDGRDGRGNAVISQ